MSSRGSEGRGGEEGGKKLRGKEKKRGGRGKSGGRVEKIRSRDGEAQEGGERWR